MFQFHQSSKQLLFVQLSEIVLKLVAVSSGEWWSVMKLYKKATKWWFVLSWVF